MGTVAHQAEPAPLARDQAEDEPREAGRDVHHVAAREVERPDGVAHEAALAAPHHVRERRVHHHGPHGHERAHRAELHATGHRAVMMAVVIMQNASWNTTSAIAGYAP